MKLVYLLLTIFGSILFLVLIYITIKISIVIWKVNHPAKNSSENFLKLLRKNKVDSRKKRIVFIGDSLTNGLLGVNFTMIVAQVLGNDYYYINAGINSQVAYNVLQRIDSVIKCEPDFITLLIGTNDAHHEINLYNLNPKKSLNLPQHPSKEFYIENLKEIISKLQLKTNAKIALCSLPPIGEDEDSLAFKQSITYSNIIKELADENHLEYLPINEEMIAYLKDHSSNPKYSVEQRLIEQLIVKHFILGISFDKISERNGFHLVSDHLHLNTHSAKIIANLIVKFVTT
ncbi:MAG TPA: GDSL-type esterase/lipase family protein [Candidatus Bathyarchaeia archaeon]|nr:GDSL-type esterase/lipase family protein [Candidatus Bathyarchaeia archaeon]